jgi:hypothetical protein
VRVSVPVRPAKARPKPPPEGSLSRKAGVTKACDCAAA